MSSATAATKMTYRFLGNSDEKNTVDAWYQMMQTAFKNGVNLFDSAENYAMGRADELMGGAIKRGIDEGVWSREDLVVTAKIFTRDSTGST
ncbi:NADP-dependent oxidoreductase domain [Phytophthora cactorum]|nr:NADP-dependent oxidoreductase domain [Phytophthora cactorum]